MEAKLLLPNKETRLKTSTISQKVYDLQSHYALCDHTKDPMSTRSKHTPLG